MKILAYLLRAKMSVRLFLVWIFAVGSGALLLGILFQLYRAARAFADSVPALMLALPGMVS